MKTIYLQFDMSSVAGDFSFVYGIIVDVIDLIMPCFTESLDELCLWPPVVAVSKRSLELIESFVEFWRLSTSFWLFEWLDAFLFFNDGDWCPRDANGLVLWTD